MDKNEDNKNVQESEVKSSTDKLVEMDDEIGDDEIMFSPNKNILFVCNSNTDISPMAEAIFNQKVPNQKAFSAGLYVQTGDEASPETIQVCANHGIDLTKHKTQNINDIPIKKMDLVLVATIDIRDTLKITYPNLNIFTINEYAGDYTHLDISDPINGDLFSYKECFRNINETILKIIDKGIEITDEHIIEEDEITDEPIKNFKYLDDLIHSGEKNIVLDSDIVLSDEEEEKYIDGIIVDIDGITINGNGFSIDAKAKTRIFNVSQSNVQILNVTLKNGFNKAKGGAIYINHATLTIKCSNFLKNYATYGGAIYNNIGDVFFEENVFKNNSVDFEGGAIFNEAGAIYQGTGGIISIDKTDFIDNSSQDGGAIYNSRNAEAYLFGCELKNNSSTRNGGAIKNYGKLSIKKCNLNSNFSGDIGGAVHSVNLLEVCNSKFDNNTSCEGGAILNEGTLRIYDSTIINNYANCGGAISNASSIKGRITSANILNCVISHNSAQDSSAIFNKEDIVINNVILKENQIGSSSAVIKNSSNSMKILSSKFIANSPNVLYNDGFLTLKNLYFDSDNFIINENKLFSDSKDYEITGHGKTYDIFPLKDNQKDFKYLDGLIKSNNEIKIESDIILDLYNCEEDEFSDGILIEETDVFIDGNNHIIDAKGKTRIFNILSKTLTLKNITLKNAFSDNGAAINNIGGKLNLINCKIIDCEADQHGGAIYSEESEITMIDSKISHNRSSFGGGGLYAFKGSATIENTIFDYNISGSNGGGAIFIDIDWHDSTDGKLRCFNSCFKYNISDRGGAIRNNAQMEISYCEFSNNHSDKKGSAVFQGDNNGINSFITHSTFFSDLKEENEMINIFSGHSTIKNNKFIFQNQNDYIIVNDSSMRLTKSHFEYRGIKSFKKYIFSNGDLKILKMDDIKQYIELTDECNIIFMDDYDVGDFKTFEDLNNLLNNGSCEVVLEDDFVMFEFEQEFFEGGIDLDSENLILDGQGHSIDANGFSRIFNIIGNVVLKDITFKNGKTYQNKFGLDTFGGGAINISYGSSVKLIKCNFINNTSKNSAGAIINKGELILKSSTFYNNISQTRGGAIYNCRDSVLSVDMCVFESNDSFSGGVLHNEGCCELFNSNLLKNTSKKGGGIYNVNILDSNNCIFEKNKCLDVKISNQWVGGFGGAIHSHDGVLYLKDNTYRENSSTDGGAIYTNSDDITLLNSAFLRNFQKGEELYIMTLI